MGHTADFLGTQLRRTAVHTLPSGHPQAMATQEWDELIGHLNEAEVIVSPPAACHGTLPRVRSSLALTVDISSATIRCSKPLLEPTEPEPQLRGTVRPCARLRPRWGLGGTT